MPASAADLKQLAAVETARREMVSTAKNEFGVKQSPDGKKWKVDIDLTKGNNRQKLIEMRKRYVEAANARSATLASTTPTVAAINPSGATVRVNAAIEPLLARKGFRPRIWWGRGKRITGGVNPDAPLRTWAEIQAEKEMV